MPVIATITSKGQITIPLKIRQRLKLKTGDRIEFDEEAPGLVARRVVDRSEWETTLTAWRNSAARNLKGHPWEKASSAKLVDDARGGPVEHPRRKR